MDVRPYIWMSVHMYGLRAVPFPVRKSVVGLQEIEDICG